MRFTNPIHRPSTPSQLTNTDIYLLVNVQWAQPQQMHERVSCTYSRNNEYVRLWGRIQDTKEMRSHVAWMGSLFMHFLASYHVLLGGAHYYLYGEQKSSNTSINSSCKMFLRCSCFRDWANRVGRWSELVIILLAWIVEKDIIIIIHNLLLI